MKKYDIDINGCWNCRGYKDKDGYSQTTLNGKRMGSHRAAYIIAYGPFPKDLYVLHKCDNPACVNPDHLFLGTAKDNYDDAASKGRAVKGSKNGQSKLTNQQVLEIRKDTRRQIDIAAQYGILQTTVSAIKTGQNWRHLQ
jgi:hypothetical protein